jgi:hypothetical protein
VVVAGLGSIDEWVAGLVERRLVVVLNLILSF